MKHNASRCLSAMLLFTMAIFLNLGCQRSDSESMDFMTIDFTSPDATITVNLEEISDQLQMIRLETKDESLIGHFWGYVGQSHIIYIGNDHVLHFSGNGTFIRRIIQKGRGPGEFSSITAWDVDADENYFMFYDSGKDFLYKYDLNLAEFASSIPYDQQIPLDNFQIINDTLLAFLPYQYSDFEHRYFLQTTNGNMIYGPKRETIEQQDSWVRISSLFKKTASGSIIYRPNNLDTIYQINNETMKPYLLSILKKKQKSGNTTSGEYVDYIYETSKNMLLNNYFYKKETGSSYSSITTYIGSMFIIDKDELLLLQINELKSDFMGLDLRYLQLRSSQDNRYFFTMSATAMMDRIDQVLGEHQLSDDQLKKIKQLQKSITENDNPIIFTGAFKDDFALSMVD